MENKNGSKSAYDRDRHMNEGFDSKYFDGEFEDAGSERSVRSSSNSKEKQANNKLKQLTRKLNPLTSVLDTDSRLAFSTFNKDITDVRTGSNTSIGPGTEMLELVIQQTECSLMEQKESIADLPEPQAAPYKEKYDEHVTHDLPEPDLPSCSTASNSTTMDNTNLLNQNRIKDVILVPDSNKDIKDKKITDCFNNGGNNVDSVNNEMIGEDEEAERKFQVEKNYESKRNEEEYGEAGDETSNNLYEPFPLNLVTTSAEGGDDKTWTDEAEDNTDIVDIKITKPSDTQSEPNVSSAMDYLGSATPEGSASGHSKDQDLGSTVPDKTDGDDIRPEYTHESKRHEDSYERRDNISSEVFSDQSPSSSTTNVETSGCSILEQNSDITDMSLADIHESGRDTCCTPMLRHTEQLLRQTRCSGMQQKSVKSSQNLDSSMDRKSNSSSRRLKQNGKKRGSYFCKYCHKKRAEPNRKCKFPKMHIMAEANAETGHSRCSGMQQKSVKSSQNLDSSMDRKSNSSSRRLKQNGKKRGSYFCKYCHKKRAEPNRKCKFPKMHIMAEANAETGHSASPSLDWGVVLTSLSSQLSNLYSSYKSTESQLKSDLVSKSILSKKDNQRLVLKEFCKIQLENKLHCQVKTITQSLLHIRPVDLKVFPYHENLNNGREPSGAERYSHESARNRSFDCYRGSGLGVVLATNGFYHNRENGPASTRCFKCGASYSNWEFFDNVPSRHRPNCQYYNGDGNEAGSASVPVIPAPVVSFSSTSSGSLSHDVAGRETTTSSETGAGSGATSTVTSSTVSSINTQQQDNYSYQLTTDRDNTEYTSNVVLPDDEDDHDEPQTTPDSWSWTPCCNGICTHVPGSVHRQRREQQNTDILQDLDLYNQ